MRKIVIRKRRKKPQLFPYVLITLMIFQSIVAQNLHSMDEKQSRYCDSKSRSIWLKASPSSTSFCTRRRASFVNPDFWNKQNGSWKVYETGKLDKTAEWQDEISWPLQQRYIQLTRSTQVLVWKTIRGLNLLRRPLNQWFVLFNNELISKAVFSESSRHIGHKSDRVSNRWGNWAKGSQRINGYCR